MGRSYSEYPFQDPQPMANVQGSGTKLGNDEDKQKVAQQQKADLPDEGIHYRQPHAETLQRLKQKREARKAAAQSEASNTRRAAEKKATATRKTATAKKTTAKKTPMVKAAPEKAPSAKKSAERTESATASLPARGKKALTRVAAAAKSRVASVTQSRVASVAKKTVQRVAKKVGLPKALKRR